MMTATSSLVSLPYITRSTSHNTKRPLVVSHIETGGQSRHSGESRNPEKSTTWTPAFAGVTVQLIHAF
ncbi:MAG: hypothetical protein M1547_04915, partial [Gammaproteobacteria bacterium]|nr:hypothetical protein [Gammaproteobacteria bacterium]